jgi:hypothetical protein
MFNISNIINSPLITVPWKHQIIENFFSDTDYYEIEKASKKLQKKYENKIISADQCLSIAEAYECIGEKAFDIIINSNRTILNNIESIVKSYPNHYKHNNYISFPSFHILPPNTPWQKIHDEASDKTVSIVVYLYPNQSVGTCLYSNQRRDSFVKEIEWKKNSSMLFCGEKNVTWHDFCSKDYPRITLNYFIRTLQIRELREETDNYYWIFGNGLKTFIPKNLPKSKLELLTSDILFRDIKW